ncbi:MAG: DUF3179 domain-containing protein [Acidobacteriota bacterium]
MARVKATFLKVLLLCVSAALASAIDPALVRDEWPEVDFQKAVVDLRSIQAGGPPRDGILAVTDPKFESIAAAGQWIGPQEPVILVELSGEARIYPIQILIFHEVVNDVLASRPILVTFCPLCYSALAFLRHQSAGQVLTFGVTGLLRHSNMIMYDHQTVSWWQQATGQAIVGSLAGKKLTPLPAKIVSFRQAAARKPRALVLSRPGRGYPYGRNPYVGYDDIRQKPFLFRGVVDKRVPPMEHLIVVTRGAKALAFPLSALRRSQLLTADLNQEPVVAFYNPDPRTALETPNVAAGRVVGTGAVFSRRLDEVVLDFSVSDGKISDTTTGSEWNHFGEAIQGPLSGKQLVELPSSEIFAFAWLAFRPDTKLVISPDN